MRTSEVDTLYISRKFRVLSFFAAIAVVFIHSATMTGMEDQAAWCRSVIDIYRNRITCWAVPFFFVTAGYWFSQGGYMRRRQTYLVFLKNKVRSLIIPYTLFIVIAFVVSMPAVVSANIIAQRPILANTLFAEKSLFDAFNQMFGLTILFPKPLGVMWFIRTLFIVFLFAPAYRFLAQRCAIFFPIGMILFFGFIPEFDIPYFPIWFNLAIWFYLGLWIGVVRGGNLVKAKASIWVPILLLAIGCLWGFKIVSFQWLPLSGMVVKLSFILGIWFMYDYVDCYLPTNLPKFLTWSFWLYCTHNMIVLYAIAFSRWVFGRSDVVICILPLFVCAFTIVLSLLIAKFLEKKVPRVFTVLTGGRIYGIKK